MEDKSTPEKVINKPDIPGWEITVNENGIEMATLKRDSLIQAIEYIEYLENKLKK